MTDIAVPKKCMTFGEGGTAIAFAALAVATLLIAANAHTAEYAFHAYLSAAASIAVVFLILSRYYDRPDGLPPLTVEGKPNYNFGPIKFATAAAVYGPTPGRSVRSSGQPRSATMRAARCRLTARRL